MFYGRSDAIWSRLRNDHGNTGVGPGRLGGEGRGGPVAHPLAQSGHVQ